MDKMKAFVRTDAQTMDVALIEVDVPSIDAKEVLVKVEAFGVGVHDRYFIPSGVAFPFTIGSEGAGVITKVGRNVTDYKVGDRVIMSSSLQDKGGCWAHYAAVSTNQLIHLPEGMPFTDGAALPVAGKTAIECMRTLDLTEGDTLFIAGASGAIGTLMIQLAKSKGIRVISSASQKNHAYMQSLGAEMTVDYKSPTWKNDVIESFPNGVDAALAIQRGTAQESIDIVKGGGKVITVSGDPIPSERGITVQQFPHLLDFQTAMQRLLDDITTEHVRVVIEHTYPFAEAIDALTKTETRHARGKLVVLGIE